MSRQFKINNGSFSENAVRGYNKTRGKNSQMKSPAHVTSLKQHPEYTQKHNTKVGRHGWLRLTPAYSLKLVEEILAHVTPGTHVLDPFSGTGTTALCATQSGHEATTIEINPFLVWFGRAKVARYDAAHITAAQEAANEAISALVTKRVEPVPAPPIHNVLRWWSVGSLRFLCSLLSAIESSCRKHNKSKDLLLVAFCRTLIRLSNAAFNHQSMSFKDQSNQRSLFSDDNGEEQLNVSLFLEELSFVLDSALDNPSAGAKVIHGDACSVATLASGPFDVLITSPPYPNRISYIRELRPYMYWLGFLKDAKHAAELDWCSIGGTWGSATSRLKHWRAEHGDFCPQYLSRILGQISDGQNTSGVLLSNYVGKYFADMFRHLSSVRKVLSPQATVHYIVGNSSFYGVLLPVEMLYADMLADLGFTCIEVKPIRKRNSKKELVEFVVSARWK
jgi:DNA modification methylase